MPIYKGQVEALLCLKKNSTPNFLAGHENPLKPTFKIYV